MRINLLAIFNALATCSFSWFLAIKLKGRRVASDKMGCCHDTSWKTNPLSLASLAGEGLTLTCPFQGTSSKLDDTNNLHL